MWVPVRHGVAPAEHLGCESGAALLCERRGAAWRGLNHYFSRHQEARSWAGKRPAGLRVRVAPDLQGCRGEISMQRTFP